MCDYSYKQPWKRIGILSCFITYFIRISFLPRFQSSINSLRSLWVKCMITLYYVKTTHYCTMWPPECHHFSDKRQGRSQKYLSTITMVLAKEQAILKHYHKNYMVYASNISTSRSCCMVLKWVFGTACTVRFFLVKWDYTLLHSAKRA